MRNHTASPSVSAGNSNPSPPAPVIPSGPMPPRIWPIVWPLAKSGRYQAVSLKDGASTASNERRVVLSPWDSRWPAVRCTSAPLVTASSGMAVERWCSLRGRLSPEWRTRTSAPTSYMARSTWLRSKVELKELPITPRAVARATSTTSAPGTTGSRDTRLRPWVNQGGATGADKAARALITSGNRRITTSPKATSPKAGPKSRL